MSFIKSATIVAKLGNEAPKSYTVEDLWKLYIQAPTQTKIYLYNPRLTGKPYAERWCQATILKYPIRYHSIFELKLSDGTYAPRFTGNQIILTSCEVGIPASILNRMHKVMKDTSVTTRKEPNIELVQVENETLIDKDVKELGFVYNFKCDIPLDNETLNIFSLECGLIVPYVKK